MKAQVRPADYDRWLESFAARYTIEENGCWTWTGSTHPLGYGYCSIRIEGEVHTVRAHRLAWMLAVGPIPDGLSVDHLCENKICCNPDHLEPVTHQENVRRSVVSRFGSLRPCGTWSAYVRGCRCAQCRQAATTYVRERARSREPRHGTLTQYTNGGCRCEPCRAAGAAYRRDRKRRAS